MIVDPAVLPGLLFLAAELAALAAVGYVIVRVALRQDDERMALAHGLVVGPALWGLLANFAQYVVPGLAGAAVGWVVMLTLGAVLAWRAPDRIRPRPRVAAGFAVAVLTLVLVALASRQLQTISDFQIRLGLASAIRAGQFPPEIFYNPDMPLRYHHGIPLLTGLLMPPMGPDLGLVTELLGAYVWTSLFLIVTTALLQRSSALAALIVAPLLLNNGLWTFANYTLGVLVLPVPSGLPAPGLLESLTNVYWPSVELAPHTHPISMLPDISKPAFPLGYALAFVVLQYAARPGRWTWRLSVTLAGLMGFLGLLTTSLVPVVAVLWAGLAVWHVMRARRSGSALSVALQSGTGLALAGLLILASGGAFTGILDGTSPSGLELAPSLNAGHGEALGTFTARSGGVGLLGLGPLAVAGVAVVMARRDRLVLALASGAVLLAFAWMVLAYPPAPWDVNRFAGHARNLALVALMLALVTRLTHLQSRRWRYGVGGLLVALVVWPTIVVPVRSLGLAIGNGIQLANARWVQEEMIDRGVAAPMRRAQLPSVSDRIADYIRAHTAPDALVLATEWPYWNVYFSTGRPNNAGFAGLTHLNHEHGPDYLDAAHFLDPSAIRRLGIEYVHATDAWVATLPQRARAWLGDPRFFEHLVRDGRERLYRVRPAFLGFDVSPNPAAFEALRQATPPSATVYLVHPPTDVVMLRVASALSHTRLVGQLDPQQVALVSTARWHVDALTEETPDLVVLPTNVFPWMFEPSARTPIWWRRDVAVYAPNGAVPRIMDAPAPVAAPGDPPPVHVAVTDVTAADDRIEFVASFEERSSEGWTSQDWVILSGDRSPWAIPTEVFRRGDDPTIAKWFGGLLSSGSATTTHTYRFDVRTAELSVRNDAGAFVPLPTSAANLGPGGYTLVLRLREEYQSNHWRDAAVVPVLRIRVAETGDVAFEIFDDVLDERTLPRMSASFARSRLPTMRVG